jgi:DNA adenine methylase
MKVTRPLMRYYGGKWRIAPWIIEKMPPHRCYTECFGGAASVLLRKQRAYSEVYNDLDGEIVNVFRVLRNPALARDLVRVVRLTPYAREEFKNSYLTDGDPVEQARRTFFRAAAGFASGAQLQYGTGFRSNVTRQHTTSADNWRDMPDVLEQIIERLRGVIIENEPAIKVLCRYDGPMTLHYVDPPYVYATRNERNAGSTYRHEMTDEQHKDLADTLHDLAGVVIVSGYPSPLYEDLYANWQRWERAAKADGARDRIEVLWINRPVQANLF